jgi:hypothetical protein
VGLIALRLPSVPGRVKVILLPVRSDAKESSRLHGRHR